MWRCKSCGSTEKWYNKDVCRKCYIEKLEKPSMNKVRIIYKNKKVYK